MINNLTIRFSSERETNKMAKFLESNGQILAMFKNDNNNNISSQFDVAFSYALEHQVPANMRKLFLNIRTPEVAPYVWRLACWMSFRSSFREGLDPVLYFNDEKFKLVIHPTGRESEIPITPEGMPIEKELSATWKYLHRNKEHNEGVFRMLVDNWNENEQV